MQDRPPLSELYPELASVGGLVHGLQDALAEIGSPLTVRTKWGKSETHPRKWREKFPDSVCVCVGSGSRMSQVFVNSYVRLFQCDLWCHGVCMGRVAAPNILAIAAVLHNWIHNRVKSCELKSDHVHVEINDHAQAFENGTEVEYQWNRLEQTIPTALPELSEFFNIARNTPKLRPLYPYTSHYSFCFSRCTGYPFTFDCPAVTPKWIPEKKKRSFTAYKVSLPADIPLGEGDAKAVLELVLKHLPANCGPAVAGTADTISL